MIRITAILLACSAFAILVVSCSGDSNERSRAPESDRNTAVSVQDDFQRFTSSSKGYSITYPTAWGLQEDGFTILDFAADVFIGPSIANFQTNVNVLCDEQGAGMTPGEYLAANLISLRQLGADPGDSRSASTRAGDGLVISYQLTTGAITSDQMQAYVVTDACAWVITLAVAEGHLEEYTDDFLAMISSFGTTR